MQCRQHGLKLIVIVVIFVIALMTWWRTSALAANRLIMRNYGSHSEFGSSGISVGHFRPPEL